MRLLTNGLSTDEIIALAATRPEFVWHWGERLNREEAEQYARRLGDVLQWGVPIRPGDLYLARRNTGYHLMTCRNLGEACVHPTTPDYAYDFNECVKVE